MGEDRNPYGKEKEEARLKKGLLIVGAGGHGRVVADIAKKTGLYDQIAFLDDDLSKEVPGYKLLGTVKEYQKWSGSHEFVVAVGNNRIRRGIQKMLEKQVAIVTLVHPSAVIGEWVELGIGTVVMANAVVNSGTAVGEGVILNTGSTVDHDCRIGSYAHVAPGSHISGNVSVGEGSWVGVGSSIVNNVSICERCMIGAGAIVVDDIREAGTYVGIPARLLRRGGGDA